MQYTVTDKRLAYKERDLICNNKWKTPPIDLEILLDEDEAETMRIISNMKYCHYLLTVIVCVLIATVYLGPLIAQPVMLS